MSRILKKVGYALATAIPISLANIPSANAVIVTPDDARLFGLDSLATVPVPEPVNLVDFIQDRDAAIALGKALFWDQQVGSDGNACASCHFHAGADSRVKNQLSPGLLRVTDPDGVGDADTTFGDAAGLTASAAIAGPNYTLNANDFPLHQLADPLDRNSAVTFDSNDVVSSQGTFAGDFINIPLGRVEAADTCGPADPSLFHSGGIATRKVEPRNTPTTINAVFNHRNFWDGRANNIFNGLNPLGKRGNLPTAVDANPGILVMNPADGTVATVAIEIDNASLASQAVGPPLSDFEMSCANRTFADLGKKMLVRRPLRYQSVAFTDSVLRFYRNFFGRGLYVTYETLIKRAFLPQYWAKPKAEQAFDAFGEPLPNGARGGYSQMEVNFPLFWGLAIQMYEATLVSDQTPFDLWMTQNTADPVPGFGAQELAGLDVFTTVGQCVFCHVGPEFTSATLRAEILPGVPPLPNGIGIERMLMLDGGPALYDIGFYNIGVSPTTEDLGVGGNLAGFPLSFARQIATNNAIDVVNFDPTLFEVPGPIVAGERVDVDGAFKVPTLRNVELTGPFFHTGGYATLDSVVEFYNRGGNRRDVACDGIGSIAVTDANGTVTQIGDTSGFDGVCTNVPPDMAVLGLTAAEQAALVAFMKSLTDPRVRINAAPFDHPELILSNGQNGDQFSTVDDGTGRAIDDTLTLPATGSGGDADIGTFLGL